MHQANIVPLKMKVADFLQKSAGGITQTLAALATLATLPTILDGYSMVVRASVFE
jgi:hypothetical protein